MRKLGLLIATAAVTLGISASSASAGGVSLTPQLQLAAQLCQQQGGVFYPNDDFFKCKGTMTLFDLVKAKAMCSVVFRGTLSLLSPVEVPILLLPNGGYRCDFVPLHL